MPRNNRNRDAKIHYAARQAARHPVETSRCAKHPDRFAATAVAGISMCWQCYLPPDFFNERFGPKFYEPGGPGYAGES